MELIKKIHASLPQIQCGRCDTPGCYQYAEQIAEGIPHDRCVPGGSDTLQKLNNILDKEIHTVDQNYGPTIKSKLAIIREEDCIGCKKCIGACPVDAIVGATNLMHSIINDICTGCELCIEPCPVDCIDLVDIPKEDMKKVRDKSQQYFDLKESIKPKKKRTKLKNNSSINKDISSEINYKITNRGIDKDKAFEEMQENILTGDLKKLHNFKAEQIDGFLKEKNET